MAITITTTECIDGAQIVNYLGMVRGSVVRHHRSGSALLAAVSHGGIVTLEEQCETARQESCERMISLAIQIGANAVVGVRYDSCTLGGALSLSEVICYGTAVITEPTR